jgi:hypothetical protein
MSPPDLHRLPRRRILRPPLFLLAALALTPRCAFASDPPARIERIEIVRTEIFDSSRVEERHLFGDVVNALHVLTREDAIRQELLFTEGDILDERAVEESARILRSLGYLGDAQIETRKSGDSSVVVRVITQDRWSMDMLPAFKQEGGVTTERFTLKEDNLLGMGKSLSASYSFQSDRPAPHGREISFLDRNVFGTRLRAGVRYRDVWDQTSGSFLLERPYYSDRTSWAAGVAAEIGQRRMVTYDDGIPLSTEADGFEAQRGWLSLSLGSGSILRPVVGYLRARSESADPRVFDNLDLATVSISWLDRSFESRRFLNSSGRTEDMPLGFSAGATIGKNFLSRGVPAPVYLAQASLRHSFLLPDESYIGWGLSAQRYWGGGWQDESTVSVVAVHHRKFSRLQTLVAQVELAAGFGWSGGRQMVLGSSTGLRGYAEGAFAGDRRIRYGIEERFFSDLTLFIFDVGAVAFLDGGAAWSGDTPVSRLHFSHAAGVGLRIENTKVQGAGLVRLDVAFNLDEGRAGHVTISSALPFSAFLDLDAVSGLWSPERE